MRRERRSTSFYSTFLILVLFAFSLSSVQGLQATQSVKQIPLLIPPPPSTPYWTYDTGDSVWATAVSADGSTIVAGSYNHKINVFGRESNATLWTYEASASIESVAVSANGSTIVVGVANPDNRILVFGRASNATIWTYTTGGLVHSVAVSADGNTIVAGGTDQYVRVFGRHDNTTVWARDVSLTIMSVGVSADGKTIVVGDWSIRAFGRQDNTTLWTYQTIPSSPVWSVAVSDDGNTIVAGTGGLDESIHVYQRQDNTTVWNCKTTEDVFSVAVSSDGGVIAAGGDDGHLRVFARASNATLIDHDTGGNIHQAVAVSSDGSIIACGTCMTSFKELFYSRSLGLLFSYAVSNHVGSSYYGRGASVSGDGSIAVYGCSDSKLYVFQYDTAAPVLGAPTVVPSSPVGGQRLNISISVTDNLGVSAVNLHYWNTSAGSWSSVAMSLAGAAYKATMGPFSSGDVVGYYITAEDASGGTASSPADAPLSYYTITVGTSPPPSGGTTTPEGIQWTSVLIGAGLGAAIAIIISFAMMRGKKSGR